MISITCTQCRALLTIDDAFAGGVCRCQHCGTIQTVPIQLKPSATPQPYVNPSATKSKSLYQKKARAGMSGANVATSGEPSGLDDLAQAVASSSGLSGSGLRSSHLSSAPVSPPRAMPAAPPVEAPPPTKIPLLPIAIGAGALVLILLVVIIVLLIRGAGSNSPTNGGGSAGGTTSGGPATPAFCGMPLAGTNVVYLVDRANSIANDFDPAKAAVFQSISTLGPERKFAVILWNNGGADIAFPADGTRNATSDQIEQLKHSIEDITATGSSRLKGALQLATSRSPDVIVIVTSKTKLDEEDENAVTSMQESAAGKIKIDVVTVGGARESDNSFLKLVTKTTGGEYRHFSSSELRAATP